MSLIHSTSRVYVLPSSVLFRYTGKVGFHSVVVPLDRCDDGLILLSSTPSARFLLLLEVGFIVLFRDWCMRVDVRCDVYPNVSKDTGVPIHITNTRTLRFGRLVFCGLFTSAAKQRCLDRRRRIKGLHSAVSSTADVQHA